MGEGHKIFLNNDRVRCFLCKEYRHIFAVGSRNNETIKHNDYKEENNDDIDIPLEIKKNITEYPISYAKNQTF